MALRMTAFGALQPVVADHAAYGRRCLEAAVETVAGRPVWGSAVSSVTI